MRKTAKEIALRVLSKVAIDLPTLRRASRTVMKNKGVRGGIDYVTEQFLRRPKNSLGPLIDPSNMAYKGSPITMSALQTLASKQPLDPAHLKSLPGKLFTGGGKGGTFSGILSRHGGASPYAPGETKEILNRIGPLHESFELKGLGRGKTVAQRAKNWGQTASPDQFTGYGHVDPSVILKERNLVNTLPKTPGARDAARSIGDLREMEGSMDAIQEALGRELPYGPGEGRLSRHAIKRITGMLQR